jgi:hypothetical protein
MKKIEICIHCNTDYIPTRRGVQKFCSKSCKSRYWYLKQNKGPKDKLVINQNKPKEQQNTNNETMSFAGVGNAAAGTALVELAKNVLGIAPATKKDIQELKSFIKRRYLPINNLMKDSMGRFPFYDVETGHVVYLFKNIVF